jgi:hypothetical protein
MTYTIHTRRVDVRASPELSLTRRNEQKASAV